MQRKYVIVGSIVLGLLVLFQLTSGLIDGLEQESLDMRYHLRGQVPADTNVVILYFDNDDIASLGGGTLKRNYYALLLDVLTKSHVAAVGLEPFFGEQSLEYPEQDDLLASTAAASGRVVFSSYFRQVDTHELPAVNGAAVDFPSYGPMADPPLFGAKLQLPFRSLLQAAAGIGHTNITDGFPSRIPLLISTHDRTVPAMGLEVLRLYAQTDRSDVRIERNAVILPSKTISYRVPMNRDGTTTMNFPGPISSFRRYRCVEVLRSYQMQQLGVPAPVDLSTLENKVVLVSIIGEGRSEFFLTPFDTKFPSVGVTATFIDNALQGRFLTGVSPFVGMFLIPLLLNGLLMFLVHRFGTARGGVFGILLAILYISTAQFLFVGAHMAIPVVAPMFFLMLAWIGPVFYDYFVVGKQVARLESDKEHVEFRLRESELKLQTLERELSDQKTTERSARVPELLGEIQRYKEEVRTLSAQVSDMVKFETPSPEQRKEVAVFEGIVYHTSGKMDEVVDLIRKIAASEANVLVLGESGTGKELVARAVHNLSGRRGKPFVAVNCGALTETLLESELFGHERGSFTGAVKDKVGRFEYANGGTIFLDEIAETSESFQVKLLRVVQSGEFERVGSTVTRTIDARIVAATNKNLRELVSEKRFREDLYYRLNVFSIELPPLRERKADIPLLADHFVRREDGSLSLSSTVMDVLLQHPWRGNVRELESAITRAGILARSERRTLIQIRDLPEAVVASAKEEIDIEDQILEILRSKKFSRSSISETAEMLGGLNRGTVAEYFRGICFKHFFESSWDEEAAVGSLAPGGDAESGEKVQKKLREYLSNVVEGVTPGGEFEGVRTTLRPKFKNLPQRYHTILDELIRAYLQGKWK